MEVVKLRKKLKCWTYDYDSKRRSQGLHRKRSFCLCNLKKLGTFYSAGRNPEQCRAAWFVRLHPSPDLTCSSGFFFFITFLYPAPHLPQNQALFIHHSTQPTRDGQPVHLVVVGSRKASLTLTSERCHTESEKVKCAMYPEFTASCPHLNPRLLSPRWKKKQKKKIHRPQLHTLPLSRC